MGIGKKINELFRENCPNAFKRCDIEEFRGRKVAIDAGIHINKFAATVNKSLISKLKCPTDVVPRYEFVTRLEHDILMFTFGLMKRGVLPVFCFDGERHPLKMKTIAARGAKKSSNREKAAEALEEYESLNPLEITDDIDKELIRRRSYDFYVSRAEQDQIKSVLMSIGIPCFRAEYEAEKLCASFALEGIVDGVMTVDTDCYALGVPLMITNYDFAGGYFDVVDLTEIITFFCERFECGGEEAFAILVDFCILCGCDFNEKFKGIAEKKALQMIDKYRCIERIAGVRDITCLNHVDCREIFAYQDSGYYSDQVKINWEQYDSNITEVLSKYSSHPLNNVSSLINKSHLTTPVIRYSNGI